MLYSHPLRLIEHQKLSDKVSRTRSDMMPLHILFESLEVAILGWLCMVQVSWVSEGRVACEEYSRDATQGPEIYGFCVAFLVGLEDLPVDILVGTFSNL